MRRDQVRSGVVAGLAAQLVAATSAIPELAAPWTLIDFPLHPNAGDSAIWLGELRLAAALGSRVSAGIERRSFGKTAIDPASTLVLHGGGNWGGLYGFHEDLRIAVLDSARGRQVVQMPQSVEFVDAAARDRSRRAVDRHGLVRLLVRDARSYERAVQDYDCEVELVPDAAFMIGSLSRAVPDRALVVHSRTDREAATGSRSAQLPGGPPSIDWLDPPGHSWSVMSARGATALAKRARTEPRLRGPSLQAFNATARANVARGAKALSHGEVVVTDRLHGHIFCVLMGVPHVVVNDQFGKVEAMWDTWTHKVESARFTSSWSTVPAALDELGAAS